MTWHIEPLSADHDCSRFTCGEPWLDMMIRRNALANQERGYGRTYVAIRQAEQRQIDGFYTVSMSSVQFARLPDGLRFAKMPKYPMPTAQLGCLAVATECQRQGLGGILLIHALARITAAADVVAARAVEVKAISKAARKWYLEYGFAPFEDVAGPPFHLYLPMDTARAIVLSGN